jgi:hypothetical protein
MARTPSTLHVSLHPDHVSRLHQIELFFSILPRRLLRRGMFTSKVDRKKSVVA